MRIPASKDVRIQKAHSLKADMTNQFVYSTTWSECPEWVWVLRHMQTVQTSTNPKDKYHWPGKHTVENDDNVKTLWSAEIFRDTWHPHCLHTEQSTVRNTTGICIRYRIFKGTKTFTVYCLYHQMNKEQSTWTYSIILTGIWTGNNPSFSSKKKFSEWALWIKSTNNGPRLLEAWFVVML